MSNRFLKISATNKEAPDDATDHVAILDTTTGLMWSKTLPGGEVSQPKAVEAAAAVDLLGKDNWRLPTRAELLTLVDETRHGPAIDPIFECESDWYWTSTPAAWSPADFAWGVFFDGGDCFDDHHGGSGFVRAVRPSQ